MCDDNPQHDEDEATRLIKEVWKKPRELSREEAVEFITRKIYMGAPERIPAKARGRKPKRTQYDDAFDRRKGLYHRLVRLPTAGTAACRSKGGALREIIKKFAVELVRNTSPHKLVSAISRRMTRDRIQPPDDSTLRKKLRELGYRIPRK